MFSLPLAVSAIVVLITYGIAAWQDWRSRTVYRTTWYPAALICLVSTTLFWTDALHLSGTYLVFFLSIVLAVIFAAFAFFRLFGVADAIALALLSLAVPITPFAEWLFPSLAVSTIINAGLLSLAIPVGCLLYNLVKQNHAPFWIMCSGYPVRGDDVSRHHGFLAEEIQEIDGVVTKRFYNVCESLFALKRKNEAEIELCKRCDTVWITIGIPLLVPLTAGLILAMFGVSALDAVLAMLL